MLEGPVAEKSIDVKKAEHLKEGVKPIMACVGWGRKEEFEEGISGGPIQNSHNVNFSATPKELEKIGFKNDGRGSYVISAIDNVSKYSKEFYNCTGLVVTGTEKITGENISFMSHQNPDYFLNEKGYKFPEDLKKHLQELKSRCEGKTVDAVIVGGSYAKAKELKEPHPYRNIFMYEYVKSIKVLSEIVKKELGFEPLVITGPKTIPAADCVFYDNGMRRLYLFRGSDDFNAVQSFTPREIEEKRKDWKPGEWGLPE